MHRRKLTRRSNSTLRPRNQCIPRLSVDWAGLPARRMAKRGRDDELDGAGPLRAARRFSLAAGVAGRAATGQPQTPSSGIVPAVAVGGWARTAEGFRRPQLVAQAGGPRALVPAATADSQTAGGAQRAAVVGLAGTGPLEGAPGGAAAVAGGTGAGGGGGGPTLGVLSAPLSLPGAAGGGQG